MTLKSLIKVDINSNFSRPRHGGRLENKAFYSAHVQKREWAIPVRNKNRARPAEEIEAEADNSPESFHRGHRPFAEAASARSGKAPQVVTQIKVDFRSSGVQMRKFMEEKMSETSFTISKCLHSDRE